MEQITDSIYINFKVFRQIIKKDLWLIIGITLVFTILGSIYAFTAKEEYQVEGKILPELQSKSGSIGQFAGLAALAGVDLSSATGGMDAVRPDLYPDVLKTTPFFLRLFQEKVKDKDNRESTFQYFYNKLVLKNKLKVKDQKNYFMKSDKYISFNRQTEKNILDLKKRIVCNYDKKTGVISISVKMPDPVVAAEVTRFTMNYLTDYIINYRTEKQKEELEFLAERLSLAKGKYYTSQSKKVTYTDQMPLNALRLQIADLQRERIESEYKTSASFYNSLLQKYEEAKLKIQQETPVIKVLEPPVVPNLRIEPKRGIILFLALVIGLSVSLLLIFVKNRNLILGTTDFV
jgi:uncharacterized protein involved in exopolysaccharide biosynthesis